jgi:hypothetical protein
MNRGGEMYILLKDFRQLNVHPSGREGNYDTTEKKNY